MSKHRLTRVTEDALLERVRLAVAELCDGFEELVVLDDGTRVKGNLPALIDLLDEETRGATGSSGAGSSTESRVPFFTPAYDALMAIAAAGMRLTGILELKPRADVKDSLRGVLGGAAGRDESTLRRVAGELEEVVALARHVLSIDLPPIHLRGVLCPYCGKPSILASRRETRAWCSTRDCVDPEDRRYVWDGELALRLLGASQDTPPVVAAVTAEG